MIDVEFLAEKARLRAEYDEKRDKKVTRYSRGKRELQRELRAAKKKLQAALNAEVNILWDEYQGKVKTLYRLDSTEGGD